MKFSAVVFSSFSLALSAAASKETTNHVRRRDGGKKERDLQFEGLEDIVDNLQNGGGLEDIIENLQNGDDIAGPLQEIMNGLQSGFTEMIAPDLSLLQAMDPLVLGDGEPQTFVVEDTFNLTTCTGPINVTVQPGTIVTGLSTVTMDRFELVPNTQQGEETGASNNWLTGLFTWSGIFDMLASADEIVMEGNFSIATEDLSCLGEQGAPTDSDTFSSGVRVTLVNPVLDMKLDIGGETPETMGGGIMLGSSIADSITPTDDITFTFDSWTIEFDNPAIEQTINVQDIIDTVSLFVQDSNTGGSGMEGFDFDSIASLIQQQATSAMKGAAFPF